MFKERGPDSLVSLAPDAGTVGDIDRAKASYRRNYAIKDIASTSPGNLVGGVEATWRQCIENGGSPDFIIAGGKFIDTYRKQVTVTHIAVSGETKCIDAGVMPSLIAFVILLQALDRSSAGSIPSKTIFLRSRLALRASAKDRESREPRPISRRLSRVGLV